MLKRILLGDVSGSGRWTAARVLLLLVVYLGLPLAAAHFYLVYRISHAAQMLASPYAGYAEVSFGSAFYTAKGGFGVRDLRIRPLHTDASPTTASEVLIETPGWLWTLQALHPDPTAQFSLPLARRLQGIRSGGLEESPPPMPADGKPAIPPTRRLAIEVKHLVLDFSGFLPEELDHFGWASASIFEAEGCAGAVHWRGEDLRAMGLPWSGSHFRWEYRATGPNEVLELTELVTPEVSGLRIQRQVTSPDPLTYLVNAGLGESLLTESYTIRDQGFVAARNRYCAAKDGVTLPALLQRHMDSVERLLSVDGLRPTGDLRSAYLRFAREGGEIALEARPSQSVPFSEYHRYSLTEQLRLYAGEFRRDEAAPVAFRFQRIRPRPFPDDFTGSTLDRMLAERAERVEQGQAAEPADESPLPSDDEPAANVALFGTVLRRARRSVFEEPPPPPEEAAAETASGPDAAGAGSAGMASPVRTIEFEQLPQHIGRSVRLTLVTGRQPRGEVETVQENGLTLRVRLPSGYATYDIPRANIRRIQLLLD
jgi:hypothetical protein